ncbi:MAG: pseudouridine synthase [Lachnospiraceae bacterium]
MEEMRINKYLSSAGVCSRRQADQMIAEGRVTVDGQEASAGMKVTGQEEICIDGKAVGDKEKPRPVLLAVNKPAGIVCTTSDKDKDNIVDFLHYPVRVYPIGRLDKASEGLILMTNQGDLVNKILKGSSHQEKEYLVRVDKPVNGNFLRAMREGVPIPDTNRVRHLKDDIREQEAPVVVTRPCRVRAEGAFEFRIILTQGLNRQIRRMCEYLGYRVRSLKRIRVMNIKLGDMPPGSCREITGAELERFMKMLGTADEGVRQDLRR